MPNASRSPKAILLAVAFAVAVFTLLPMRYADGTAAATAPGKAGSAGNANASRVNFGTVQEVTSRLKDWKRNVDRALDAQDKAKGQWEKARDAYRSVQDTAKLDSALTAWKAHLTKAIDAYRKHLEAIKAEANVDAATVSSIDAAIAKLANLQSEVAAATTKDQLAAIAKDLKQYRETVHAISKQALGKRLTTGMSQVYEKLSALASRIEKKLKGLSGNGVDTAQAEDALAQARTHLAAAKEKIDAAQALVAAITSTNKQENVAKAHEAMTAARTELKEAHRLLKEAIRLAQANAPEEEKP